MRKILATIKLEKGEPIENLNRYFSKEESNDLKNRREINLKNSNKKQFSIGDEVELDLRLKNVQEIDVKIYEINLEKHLLKNHTDIDDQVNLSFLKPTFTSKVRTDFLNPYQIFDQKITIEGIPKQMGVYIVDLQAENMTSRAVIRKGHIYCVDREMEEGQMFSFFDEDGKPISEKDGLKVWIKDKLVELDEDNYVVMDYKEEY